MDDLVPVPSSGWLLADLRSAAMNDKRRSATTPLRHGNAGASLSAAAPGLACAEREQKPMFDITELIAVHGMVDIYGNGEDATENNFTELMDGTMNLLGQTFYDMKDERRCAAAHDARDYSLVPVGNRNIDQELNFDASCY